MLHIGTATWRIVLPTMQGVVRPEVCEAHSTTASQGAVRTETYGDLLQIIMPCIARHIVQFSSMACVACARRIYVLRLVPFSKHDEARSSGAAAKWPSPTLRMAMGSMSGMPSLQLHSWHIHLCAAHLGKEPYKLHPFQKQRRQTVLTSIVVTV
jgi:hypothetical protein